MAIATEAATYADLTAFQRDILCVLARDGPMIGLAVKDGIETDRGRPANAGQLYPALDDLVEKRLVTKEAIDRRSNHYDLTSQGVGEVVNYHHWVSQCLEETND